mmetsp:Transcript_50724/g.162372  ORF Transcript_50724/g.162372 Transcript_50724/m.162372 type:complete len:218 (-) Transcript_50724:540-1193(-)
MMTSYSGSPPRGVGMSVTNWGAGPAASPVFMVRMPSQTPSMRCRFDHVVPPPAPRDCAVAALRSISSMMSLVLDFCPTASACCPGSAAAITTRVPADREARARACVARGVERGVERGHGGREGPTHGKSFFLLREDAAAGPDRAPRARAADEGREGTATSMDVYARGCVRWRSRWVGGGLTGPRWLLSACAAPPRRGAPHATNTAPHAALAASPTAK